MRTALMILLLSAPRSVPDDVVERICQATHLSPEQLRELSPACEQQSKAWIKLLTAEIAMAPNRDKREQLKQERLLYQQRKKVIAPPLIRPRIELGEVGTMDRVVTVLQVLGPKTLLVEFTYNALETRKLLILQGRDTSGLSTGTRFQAPRDECWIVSKMQTYPSADGATYTAPLLELFDLAPIAEYNRLRYGPWDRKAKRSSDSVVVKRVQKKEMVAKTLPDQKESAVPDKRIRYVNATYHGVIRLHNGRWEAVDQTGKVFSSYEYVGRTNDYVELIDRGMPTRLYPDHIDQKLNGKWTRVADGHWEE